MLAHIHINNLGIIEDLDIDFDKGLNVITGETGAGKTLVIGAMQMVCGNKISKDSIRTGDLTASAEALFFVDNNETKHKLLEKGIKTDEIVLSREILGNGRSVAKINGKLVTVNELKEVGELLIDLHGQHDNQSLLNSKTHINLLDNFSGKEIEGLIEEYKALYEQRKEFLGSIERYGGNSEQRARNMEFLKFQINEIEESKLRVGEDEELNEKRKVLANSEKVFKLISGISESFNSDEGLICGLQYIIKNLTEAAVIDKSYENELSLIKEAYYQLESVAGSLSSKAEVFLLDEEGINTVDERLDLICKLKRKYGQSISDILSSYEKIQSEYNESVNSEELLNKASEELKETEKKMVDVAKEISFLRKKMADILEKQLVKVLDDLEMPKCRFEIKVDFSENREFFATGMDKVEILFSPNLGEEVKPLSKIASGGEISRIMLSLKNVLGNADNISVMVFDEIDTGISGKTGFAVAEKMKEIALIKQVICVTHLAAIAAGGNQNYFISKSEKKDRTVTSVKKLDEEETIKEIARIVSGGNITEIALAHAKEIRNN